MSTPYAVDSTEFGIATHELEDNGLTLTSILRPPDGGELKSKLGWASLDLAEANYENARAAFLKNLPKLIKRLEGFEDNEVNRSFLRTLYKNRHGKLTFFLNVGPPTWFKPQGKVTKTSIKFGWLRAACIVAWNPKEKK